MGMRVFDSEWIKKSEEERRKRESSQNKEYHLLLSLSRHGEERLEAEYNNTYRHISTYRHTNTHTISQDESAQRCNKSVNKKRNKRIKNK